MLNVGLLYVPTDYAVKQKASSEEVPTDTSGHFNTLTSAPSASAATSLPVVKDDSAGNSSCMCTTAAISDTVQLHRQKFTANASRCNG